MVQKYISRRDFFKLTSGGLGVAIISSGIAGCNNHRNIAKDSSFSPNLVDDGNVAVNFLHGVASGDPTHEAIILWTRVTPEVADYNLPLKVSWELSTDPDFDNIVNSGSGLTDTNRDYTLKVDATALTPDTRYYYRFYCNGKFSGDATAKTLPKSGTRSVKITVVSCSNYPAGYFNVYHLASQQKDVDAILHLGDFIYEYGRDGYASEKAIELKREVLPQHELLSLNDYRTRHAQYRTDRDLQKLFQSAPMIAVWDDHEVADNAYTEGAENHQPAEGSYLKRKMAGLQAYFEWMPIRPPVDNNNEMINRSFKFGNLLDLHMLDTRIIGRDKQLYYADYTNPETEIFDTEKFASELAKADRTLLGIKQLNWLKQRLNNSEGKWQVLGQQVLMGRMNLPAAIATQQLKISEFRELTQLTNIATRLEENDPKITDSEITYYEANKGRLTPEAAAKLQLPSIPYNLDAWDGYPSEREEILATAAKSGCNLIVLSGDTHNAWANNLKNQEGKLAGVEFATPSVSSPGLETYLGIEESDVLEMEANILELINDLHYCNASNRGFMTVRFSESKATATWHFVDTIQSRHYRENDARKTTIEFMPKKGVLTTL